MRPEFVFRSLLHASKRLHASTGVGAFDVAAGSTDPMQICDLPFRTFLGSDGQRLNLFDCPNVSNVDV